MMKIGNNFKIEIVPKHDESIVCSGALLHDPVAEVLPNLKLMQLF
jgi:hypothetical protein